MTDSVQLRTTLRSQRQQLLPLKRAQFSQELFAQLKQLPLIFSAQHIACYLAFDGEIDPGYFIEWCWENNKNCYLPIIDLNSKKMQFAAYTKNSELKPNRFNILEPVNSNIIIAVDQLDVIFLPLVAFDLTGNRLGMGGGFYDHTLELVKHDSKPRRIGLAYDFQCVQDLSQKHTDVSLHGVVTSSRCYEF